MTHIKLVLLFISMLCISQFAKADDDPCDFSHSGLYSYEQVMSCYRSVPFNHDDLVNTVESLRALRETSDLREVFETEFGWRQRLADLDDPTTLEDYPNDFAFHEAVILNHKEFFNPHWRYSLPSCYKVASAFIPFDFGSAIARVKGGKQQQIVFIEGAPFWPGPYASFTGIDAREFVGMRVIAINGEDPLDYFRAFGRDRLRFDRNDGLNLNEVLQNGAYSVRFSQPHDLPPRQAADTYILEAGNGARVTVEMPWTFIRTAQQLPTDSASFQTLCLQPSPFAINPFDLPVPSSLHFVPSGSDMAVHLDDEALDSTLGPEIDWAAFGINGNADDDAVRVSDIDPDAFSGFPLFGWEEVGPIPASLIWVSVDGYITFGAGDASSDSRDVTRHISGLPRISALLTDLDSSCTGAVHADVRVDRVVVTWAGVSAYGDCSGDHTITTQVVLHSSGEIQINYHEMGFAPTATIGIAEGYSRGPLNRIDYTEDVPAQFSTGAIFESFAGGAPASAFAIGADKSIRKLLDEGGERFARELAERRELVAEKRRTSKGPRAEFFEVPPGRQAESLPVIVAKSNGAVAYQLDDTTIIRLEDFAGAWEDEVVAATDHACENSDRLLIDLRNNNGGSPHLVAWLTRFLFPDRTAPADFTTNFRVLRGNPTLDELAERARLVNGPGCWTLQEAECFMDTWTGQPMNGETWKETHVGLRGGTPEELSPLAFSPFRDFFGIPGSDAIACPGKFQDDTLIVLSNGTGASAGHFFPELIRNQATIVTMGGYWGEPLVSGISRGGSRAPFSSLWPVLVDRYAQIFGPPVEPMPALQRDVTVNIEFRGVYDRSLTELIVDAEPRGDIHINVWSDSPGTDAFVYKKAVQAVQSGKGRKNR